jgi:hypothetical protein
LNEIDIGALHKLFDFHGENKQSSHVEYMFILMFHKSFVDNIDSIQVLLLILSEFLSDFV